METPRQKRKYIYWLWNLVERGVIEDRDLHQEAGRLYKFPQCCIDNYIFIFSFGIAPGKFMNALFGPDDMTGMREEDRLVRCEKCRKPFKGK